MSKYEGDLIKSLMWAVDRVMTKPESNVVPQPEASVTPQIDAQVALSVPVEQLFIQSARPTPTEQAEAWRRQHYDDEPVEE